MHKEDFSNSIDRPRRRDQYSIKRFTEASDGELAVKAQRVHAEGYLDMDFVVPAALDDDGRLPGDIDKARGENVDYYLASAWALDSDGVLVTQGATMRKVNIPKNGTIDDLPAYRLCKDSLYGAYRELLESTPNPHKHIKEIAALAKSANASPVAIFELLRDAYHEALGKEEVWFFNIVSTTYQSLVDNFGDNALKQIGEPISFDDPRINSEVTLVPAMVVIELFIDEIRESAICTTDPHERKRLMRSFVFFSEGLSDDQLSDDSKALLAALQEIRP